MNFHPKYIPFFELLSDDQQLVDKHKEIRYVVITGSRASGKSFALSAWVNSATFKQGWGILSTRWTMSSVSDSIIPEFMERCEDLGNDNAFSATRTEVINNCTGVKITFRGLKPSSGTANSALKSIANKNVFLVEESEEIADKTLFNKVNLSIRTKEQKNIVILILNPTNINHWIYQDFIKNKRSDTMLIHTTYLDNIDHLNKSFIDEANWVKERNIKQYNHLFLGHWTTDSEGALFRQEDIESSRVDELPELKSIVISYDPAVSDSKKGVTDDGSKVDEDGIGVVGVTKDQHFYVIKDKTMHGKRLDIIDKIIELYHQHSADFVVVEINNGGDFIKTMIQQRDRTVRVQTVRATKGKAIRAQPVQALYEQGLVHHVGILPELEYEMCTWVPDSGMRSPNRIDWLVWGVTKLIKKRELIII